jgi:hypothetical protein
MVTRHAPEAILTAQSRPGSDIPVTPGAHPIAADQITYAISFFKAPALTSTTPTLRTLSWDQLTTQFTRHERRPDKNGRGFSPATYKPGTTRANINVLSVCAYVADLDHIDAADLQNVRHEMEARGLAHVLYSTYNSEPDDLRVRMIIPFSAPTPASNWQDIWHRINRALFNGLNDPQTKDLSRMSFVPTAPPDALVFASARDGLTLDPLSLPQVPGVTLDPVIAQPGAINWLGYRTLAFVQNGAPIGEQRGRAVAAARAYASAGYSVADTTDAIWQGLQACDQDPSNPWTYDHALKIAQDIHAKPATPLEYRAAAADWNGSTVTLDTSEIEHWKSRALAAEADARRLRELLQSRGEFMQNPEFTPTDKVVIDLTVMESLWAKDAPVRNGIPNARTYAKTIATKACCSPDSVSATYKKVAEDMTTRVTDDPPTAPLLKYQEKLRPGDVDQATGEILTEPRTFTTIVPNFPTAAEVYHALAEWKPPAGLERKIGERRKRSCPKPAHDGVNLVSRTLLQCPIDGQVYEDNHPEFPLPKISVVGADSTPDAYSSPIDPKISVVVPDRLSVVDRYARSQAGCLNCKSLFWTDPATGLCEDCAPAWVSA